MNRASTAVIVCAGPSFDADDLPKLAKLGDLLAINYVHIPWREQHPNLLPVFTLSGDKPRKVLPEEWLHNPEILNVVQMGHGREALRRRWPNVEAYRLEANTQWTANPLRTSSDALKGPCNSLTLAYQWLLHQGYQTICFYGCDLGAAGTYAGNRFKATEQAAKGKTKNHDKAFTLLRWWSDYSNARLVNLCPSSRLSEILEDLTLDQALADRQEASSSPIRYDYAPVYDAIYEQGYHADSSYSHAKRLAWYMLDRLPERNGEWSSVLDVGCSRGWALDHFRGKGKRVAGLDVAADAVEACRGRGHCCEQGIAAAIPFDDNSFDCYLSTDTLEHLHPQDVDKAIAEAVRVTERFICVKVCPFEDRAHWKNKVGKPLHLTVQPIQRWVDSFLDACPRGSRVVWRERHAFIIDMGAVQ